MTCTGSVCAVTLPFCRAVLSLCQALSELELSSCARRTLSLLRRCLSGCQLVLMQSAQYTSDADIKEACAAAGVQIAFTDVCFLEHKVNGKSKGSVDARRARPDRAAPSTSTSAHRATPRMCERGSSRSTSMLAKLG